MAVVNFERDNMSSGASPREVLQSLDQNTLDALPMAVYICGKDGRVVRHNRRAAEIWGRHRPSDDYGASRFGMPSAYRMEGRWTAGMAGPLAKTLSTGLSARDVELTLEGSDGRRTILLANIEPLRDKFGDVEGAIASFQDITACKLREQESDRHSRELLEALPIAIYTTDIHGRITFFNQAATDLWGYSPQIGSSEWSGSWRLLTKEGAPLPHGQCPTALALNAERGVADVEAILERADGTQIPFTRYPMPLHDSIGAPAGTVVMLANTSFHHDTAMRHRQLVNELNHRVKNTLSMVQSLVSQTVRGACDLPQARKSIDDRLRGLARTHDILTDESWVGADLMNIATTVLAGHCEDPSRYAIRGTAVRLTTKSALALSMALQELCINAIKYGALANPTGKIELVWRVEGTFAERRLHLLWQESGGPAVAAPERRGFGSRLIEWGLVNELGGAAKISFPETGVTCTMDIGLPSLTVI